MALDVEERIVLKEAAGEIRKGERFERVLSAVVRRHGGTYEDYIRIIGDVRDRSHREGLTLPQAARDLAE